jgi:glycosyltransferase involved in cell wall biosynthesis
MTPRVHLCMIVRNESKTIERCLRSAFEIADSYLICDTGSTDNTVEIIKDVAREMGKTGSIHRDEWVNFGHNRNLAIHASLEYIHAKSPGAFVLLMDSDMVLEGTLNKAMLDPAVHAYDVKITDGSAFEYRLPILVNSRYRWHYEGVTHEYICLDDNSMPARPPLDSLIIVHKLDGGERGNKSPRDLALLSAEHERDPTNSRNLFYLAQTESDMGMTDIALKHYREHLDLKAWDQEHYYSMLCIARITDKFEDIMQAVTNRPERNEAAYLAVKKLNEMNNPQAAWSIGCKHLGKNTDDILFVDRWCEHYGLPIEVGKAAEQIVLQTAQLRSDLNAAASQV